jgi:molybdopterin converting factor small subunit
MSSVTESRTEPRLITLELKWFSVLAEQRGTRKESFQIEPGVTCSELIDRLSADFLMLKQYRDYVRLAVNREYAEPGLKLQDGDEVAFITPVSGG